MLCQTIGRMDGDDQCRVDGWPRWRHCRLTWTASKSTVVARVRVGDKHQTSIVMLWLTRADGRRVCSAAMLRTLRHMRGARLSTRSLSSSLLDDRSKLQRKLELLLAQISPLRSLPGAFDVPPPSRPQADGRALLGSNVSRQLCWTLRSAAVGRDCRRVLQSGVIAFECCCSST